MFKINKKIIILFVLILLLSSNVNAENNDINTLNLVPIRDIFEKLDYDIMWNNLNKKVILTKNTEVINFITNTKDISKGYQMYIINGKSYTELDNIEKLGIDFDHIDLNLIHLKKNIKIGDTIPRISSIKLNEDELNILNNYESLN